MGSAETAESSILIAHLADLHLRDTQYATTKRGADFYAAAERAVRAAAEASDVIVCVGDIFDQSRPSPRVIGQLMQLHQVLIELDAVMLSVTGNHDLCNPTWLSTLFPDTGEVAACGIVPIDGRSVTIDGFTFTGVQPYNAEQFRRNIVDTEVAVRNADVVLYHGLVTEIVPFYAGLHNPLTVGEFPVAKKNKAWLLGDIHLQGYVGVGTGKLAGYPGSTEMGDKSEPQDKSIPIIRLTADKAEVVNHVPLQIRANVSAKVRTDAELDELMVRIQEVADKDPVVIVDFDRIAVPQTISRIHSALDVNKAVVRCYQLPLEIKYAKREKDKDGKMEDLGLDFFVSQRFAEEPELCGVALDLLSRGETDSASIFSDLIERRNAEITAEIREE